MSEGEIKKTENRKINENRFTANDKVNKEIEHKSKASCENYNAIVNNKITVQSNCEHYRLNRCIDENVTGTSCLK